MVFLSKLGNLKKKKTRFSPKFQGFFRPKSEIQGFFSGRILVISKQKKKFFTEIQRVFPAEIRNSKGFSSRNQKFKGLFPAEIRNSRVFFARMQVISKKKKRSPPKFKRVFPAEIRNSRFFFGRMQVISNKKKGLHRNSKGFSCRNQKFKGFFWPKSGDLQKIGLHRLWVSF